MVQLWLGEQREIQPLRETLALQALGTLVGAALPRALGIAEVHGHGGRDGEPRGGRHFLPPILGQGFGHIRW